MSGIFAAVSKDDNVADLVYYGTDYHSHLGTEFAGMAVINKEGVNKKIGSIRQTQFKSRFYSEYQNMLGDKGIGAISSKYEQPICVDSKFGLFCICTNERIQNTEELASKLYKKGISFSEVTGEGVNPTELVAKLILESDDLVEGIEEMFSQIKGVCSLLILTREGIYAARDRLGYSPLVVGKKEDAWAVATETSAFYNLGLKVESFLLPGEVVFLDKKGIHKKKKGRETENQINSFLWIYAGFPASSYDEINVEVVRERCGRFLAKEDNVEADLVAGVPDSGTAHAIGYAMESGFPFRRPLVKYAPGYDRSYTPSSQETRDLIAKMKLIPIKELIKGKRIVLCDDSIVRGTQLRNYTLRKLWENGAKEVHLRIACPPLLFPSKFDYTTRSIEELAARRAIKAIEGKHIEDVSEYLDCHSEKYKKMVEYIRKELGATTLKYQTIDDMVEAIGLLKNRLSLYVWTGKRIGPA